MSAEPIFPSRSDAGPRPSSSSSAGSVERSTQRSHDAAISRIWPLLSSGLEAPNSAAALSTASRVIVRSLSDGGHRPGLSGNPAGAGEPPPDFDGPSAG